MGKNSIYSTVARKIFNESLPLSAVDVLSFRMLFRAPFGNEQIGEGAGNRSNY